jgi:hypothetical protein
MNRKIIVLITAMLASGCATQGTSRILYYENAPAQVKNEIIVSKPYTQVWDIMVKEIAKSYFVINNIDKESRIINLSFSTNSPSDYVDCGKTHRTYIVGDKTEVYDYDTAGSAIFKVAAQRQEHPSFRNYAVFRREAFLEGRSNIYIAPSEKDNSSTIVTVNSRFILTIRVKGEAFAEHANGNIFSRGLTPERTFIWTCNTNHPEQHDIDEGERVTCFSKGKLEKEILSMVNK